jgi:hypothetical protein
MPAASVGARSRSFRATARARLSKAFLPRAEDAGVLLLNAASSNPKITYDAGVGGFKWTFRNYPTDENRALIVIQYAAEKRGRQFEELADRAVRLMILHLRRTPS